MDTEPAHSISKRGRTVLRELASMASGAPMTTKGAPYLGVTMA